MPETPPLEGLQIEQPASPLVLSVGAGKGGVGKSLLSATLAILFAKKGKSVLLLDADLGNASAHTFLGMDRPERNLGDLLDRNVKHMAELATPTPMANLHLISSASEDPEIANIKYAHKEKVLTQMMELPYQVIIIDCGGGTSFNTLDFFLAARAGLVVVTPEPPSVESGHRFLRAVVNRRIKQVFRKGRLQRLLDLIPGETILSRAILHPGLPEEDRTALMEVLANLDVRILANRVSRDSDARLGANLASLCRAVYPLAASSAGAIEFDAGVLDAQRSFKAYAKTNPMAPLVLSLEKVVNSLVRAGGEAIPPPVVDPYLLGFHERDYYAQLGAGPEVLPRDLAKSFQIALEPYLPSSLAAYGALTESLREHYREILENAYRVLSAAELRKRYDRELQEKGAYSPESFLKDEERDSAERVQELPAPAAPQRDEAGSEPGAPRGAEPAAPPAPAAVAAADARAEEPEQDWRGFAQNVRTWNGATLKSVREMKGVSLDEIAHETRVSKRYLAAIEEEQFKRLPAVVYVRGFAREYARCLGIQADKAARDFCGIYERWIRLQQEPEAKV